MQKMTLLFTLTFCLYISAFSKEYMYKLPETKDTTTRKYYEILEGLNRNYVLSYRRESRFHADLPKEFRQKYDSIFKSDSITYWTSYKNFFNQDYAFVAWLLKFKQDKAVTGLWYIYNPSYSSHIGECNWPYMSNSRVAIVLLENFLNGEGFVCYECFPSERNKCNRQKYKVIQNFIKENKGKNIESLRQYWKEKKAR